MTQKDEMNSLIDYFQDTVNPRIIYTSFNHEIDYKIKDQTPFIKLNKIR